MLTLILMSLLVTYILYVLWSRRHIYRLHEQLKNDSWCLPILGNLLDFVGDTEAQTKSVQKFGQLAIKQGGMTSLWFGPCYSVVVADAEIASIIMKTCLDKDESSILYDLFGNGTVFAPVPIWRVRRKVLAPTFSLKNLNQFVEIFTRQCTTMVNQLKGSAGKGTFSMWKFVSACSMDSVCESTLGVQMNAQLSTENPFLDSFEVFCKNSHLLLIPLIAQKIIQHLPLYAEVKKHIRYMHDFVDTIIQKIHLKSLKQQRSNKSDKKRNNEETISYPKTFLELLSESSGGEEGFTDLELREEMLVLIIAGTDTSAVGEAFTCLMLARHQDVQDKVYEEIREVFGDSNRPVTAADLPKLKYLEAVLKETLRLYPPVPIINRQTNRDLLLQPGLVIPNNTEILINIWAIQRNPKYWGEDAEEFRPERFLKADDIHPAAFLAFSYGSRSCIGHQYAMMSMKTAMSTLLRHYRILPAKTLDANESRAPLRVKYNIMMKHIGNYELQLENRA